MIPIIIVKDYGSGMTPFYTSLSIWVGALLLVSLLSVDNKHEALEDDTHHYKESTFT
jgi:putative membrane protein